MTSQAALSEPFINVCDRNKNEKNLDLSHRLVGRPYPISESLNTTANQMDLYVEGGSRMALSLSLLVKSCRSYGILWHYEYGTIVVRPEHLRGIATGSWVRSAISPVASCNDDLEHKYVTVKILTKVEDFVPTRSQYDMVQVKVILEPGGWETIDSKGNLYLQRRSEVGPVLILAERFCAEDSTKRFRTWATFMNMKCKFPGMEKTVSWMVTGMEKLVAVDDEGNDLPEEDIYDLLVSIFSNRDYGNVLINNGMACHLRGILNAIRTPETFWDMVSKGIEETREAKP